MYLSKLKTDFFKAFSYQRVVIYYYKVRKRQRPETASIRMAQRKGKLSYILESACFNLPNSRMLCFNRQLDERFSWFTTFLRRSSEYGCAYQVEEIRPRSSERCLCTWRLSRALVFYKGGGRYLNGYQLKIKVRCVIPFSAASFAVSTERFLWSFSSV